jgi:hypothetical protein
VASSWSNANLAGYAEGLDILADERGVLAYTGGPTWHFTGRQDTSLAGLERAIEAVRGAHRAHDGVHGSTPTAAFIFPRRASSSMEIRNQVPSNEG